jgi:hypothetical protein
MDENCVDTFHNRIRYTLLSLNLISETQADNAASCSGALQPVRPSMGMGLSP